MNRQGVRALLLVVAVLVMGCAAPAAEVEEVVPAVPTATATAIPAATVEGMKIATNEVLVQEEGGLTIEVRRVVVGDKVSVESSPDIDFSDLGAEWDAATVVGEFILVLRNESGELLNVYPDQGTVLVGSRQIDLAWTSIGIGELDDVGGEIYAGVTKVGGFWYPLARVDLAEVDGLTLRFDAASDEDYDTVGGDFKFEVDLSHFPQEPYDESVIAP